MKKRSQVTTQMIVEPTELYLEDLEQIYEYICEIADEVRISDDEYDYEEITELKTNNKSSVGEIKFTGYIDKWPQFFVFINPRSIYIRADKDSTEFLGIAIKISNLIRSRRRRNYPSPKFFIGLSIFEVIASIICIAITIIFKKTTITYLLASVVFILNIPIWVFQSRPINRIIFENKRESLPFWESNKEKIVIAIITSILTVIGTLIIKALGF